MGTRETGNSHRAKQLFHGKFCSLCQPPMSPLACGIQLLSLATAVSRITDLERARRVAEETGVGYQTVLKQAIRDGLKRAG